MSAPTTTTTTTNANTNTNTNTKITLPAPKPTKSLKRKTFDDHPSNEQIVRPRVSFETQCKRRKLREETCKRDIPDEVVPGVKNGALGFSKEEEDDVSNFLCHEMELLCWEFGWGKKVEFGTEEGRGWDEKGMNLSAEVAVEA